MMSARIACVAAALAIGVPACVARASFLYLQDLNSKLSIDPVGATEWTIDGANRLNLHQYWYRVGSSGAEQPISSLPLINAVVSNTNPRPGNDHLYLQFGDSATAPNFTISLDLFLTGAQAGSGRSDVGEIIMVDNLRTSPLDIHIFRYSDFDLNGPASIDDALLPNLNTARQSNAVSGAAVESVVGTPSRWQIGDASTILSALNDGAASILSNSVSPFSGDAAFAFQWDLHLAANDTWIISTDTQIIPEPAGLSLLAAAGIMLLRRRR
jgi:hypothetical protein